VAIHSALAGPPDENTRSLKLELPTKPGNKEGKTLTKNFKIFCSGSPEEWILWHDMDYNKICIRMSITLWVARNWMVRQMLSDEPLKAFK
jgi:hypothetical protein